MSSNPDLDVLAARSTRRPDAVVTHWQRGPLGHRVEHMTTRSLDRVTGALGDGTPFALVAKTLRPASESPIWDLIPPPLRDSVLEDLNWLDEPRVYECGLRELLPAPLTMPEVYRIDRSPDAITIWMEEVADTVGWDRDRFHRSARALGRLAGRPEGDASVRALGLGRRPLARLFHGKIRHFDLMVQAQDEFWSAPPIAAAVDARHRHDLMALADAMPALLDELEAAPHALAHGDAATDNLREPGDGRVVAIDWSFGCLAPVGSDLAQLLSSAALCRHVGPGDLDAFADTAVDGFAAGLHDAGAVADTTAIESAFAISLAVRSVFSALLVEPVEDRPEDELRERLAIGAALGRFGLDRLAATRRR